MLYVAKVLRPKKFTNHCQNRGSEILANKIPQGRLAHSEKTIKVAGVRASKICSLIFAGLNFRGLQICSIFTDFIFVDAGSKLTWLTTQYQENFITN